MRNLILPPLGMLLICRARSAWMLMTSLAGQAFSREPLAPSFGNWGQALDCIRFMTLSQIFGEFMIS
ncbi:MAG: hypothetical protein BGO12_22685 [Verrucomicrobia bacterium 61-8]|nr:MAG: hypothetical protein BGO12_22685 [Verrucomicrobia bacterium 61-8]